MAEYLNIVSTRKNSKTGKVHYTTIGRAYISGDKPYLVLDALPFAGPEGNCFLQLYPPRDRETAMGAAFESAQRYTPKVRGNDPITTGRDMDDNIPF